MQHLHVGQFRGWTYIGFSELGDNCLENTLTKNYRPLLAKLTPPGLPPYKIHHDT